MPISFGTASGSAASSWFTGSANVVAPSAPADGTTMLVIVGAGGTDAFTTPAGGWSEVHAVGGSLPLKAFVKTASGETTAIATVSKSGFSSAWWKYVPILGLDSSDPFDTSSDAAPSSTTAKSTGTTPALERSDAAAVGVWWANAGVTWSGQTNGFSELNDQSSSMIAGKALSSTAGVECTATASALATQAACMLVFKGPLAAGNKIAMLL